MLESLKLFGKAMILHIFDFNFLQIKCMTKKETLLRGENNRRYIMWLLVCLIFLNNPENCVAQITNFNIAPNLQVNINGTYPQGYGPNWKSVGSRDQLEFQHENLVANFNAYPRERKYISIGEYKGRAVVLISALMSCDCVADIDLPAGKTVLSSAPRTYKLTNFRTLNSDAPCASPNNRHYSGVWKGNITLSANVNGDILMGMVYSSFAGGDRFNAGGNMTHRWTIENALLRNEMTPVNAFGTKVAKEKAAADAQNRRKTEEEYIKRRAYFDSIYKIKHAVMLKKPAASPKTVAEYKGYQLKDIVNAKQLLEGETSVVNGYKKLDSLCGILQRNKDELIFEPDKLEPHERDKTFATNYVLRKHYNKNLIELATIIAIGDDEGFNNAIKNWRTIPDALVDESLTIQRYLTSKP